VRAVETSMLWCRRIWRCRNGGPHQYIERLRQGSWRSLGPRAGSFWCIKAAVGLNAQFGGWKAIHLGHAHESSSSAIGRRGHGEGKRHSESWFTRELACRKPLSATYILYYLQ
jgi:hypothetical protein